MKWLKALGWWSLINLLLVSIIGVWIGRHTDNGEIIQFVIGFMSGLISTMWLLTKYDFI